MALAPGSIAFVGYNADGNDGFAFIVIDTIDPGQVIFFSDNEWNGSAFNTGEGGFSWTNGDTALAAGTIVEFLNTSATKSVNIGTVSAGSIALGNSDESIFAFTGSSLTAPTTFLAAITNNNGGFSEADSGVLTNTGLTAGSTALVLPGTGGADVAVFDPTLGGTIFSTRVEALTAFNTAANFVTQDASGSQDADNVTPDAPFRTDPQSPIAGVTFSIGAPQPEAQSVVFTGPLAVSLAEGNAGTTSFSFTVSRTGGTTGDVSFGGQLSSATANGADFNGAPSVPFAFNGTIPAGQLSAMVTILVNGDTTVEPDETFTLTLQTVSNNNAGATASLGAQVTATGIVQNDDAAAPGNVINGITILDQAPSLQGAVPTPVANGDVQLVRLGNFAPAAGTNAEVVTFDPATDRAFVLNFVGNTIDMVGISTSGAVSAAGSIDLTTLDDFGSASSVAVKNGILAVSYASNQPGANGFVALFDASTGSLIKTVEVGPGPDQIVFTADGSKLLVANEAEPFSVGPTVINPEGSVSIIDVANGENAAVATTVSFDALDGFEAILKQAGVGILTGQAASQDIEPEYITVSPDGTRAYVTLQEVNAVAVLDLTNPAATKPIAILPLGGVDRSLAGNAFDGADRQGINIQNADVIGLLQPDAIASFAVGGSTYFITANEGDARVELDDEADLSQLTLDATAYANAAELQNRDTGIGRLRVRQDLGDTDGDGDIDQIFAYGGRGISIFKQNADGTITKVRETGGEFEAIIARDFAARFNVDTAENNGTNVDNRSDNKGPEPEGVDIGVVNGRTYAFVSLERVGGVMVYDVTDPANATYVGYRPPLAGEGNGPEVTKFISAEDSPTGTALVLTANEGNSSANFAGAGLTVYAALPENYTQEIRVASSSASLSQIEGNSGPTVFTFTIERTNGTIGAVDVTLSLAPGAVNGANAADFAGAPSLPSTINVTIPAGQASATVSVNVQGDTVFELNENFTLTVTGATTTQEGVTAAVSATQNIAIGTIQNDDILQIGDVQGTGHTSALVGQTVTVSGTVIAIDTNGSRGFYIQDADGDGNAATSDGIFIFTNAAPTVQVGQLVSVTGLVGEFTPNGAAPGSFSGTQIDIRGAGNGVSLLAQDGPDVAATIIGGEGGLLPPSSNFADASLFYESLEGMLVTVKEVVVTGATNNFGEIYGVVDNDNNRANGVNGSELNARGALPIEGGDVDFGNINLTNGDFNPERIQIDDDNGVLAGFVTPDANVGAQLGDVTGIVNYDFGNYQIVATQAFAVETPSALVKETTTLQAAANKLTVASYNAENLDALDPAARFTTIASEILNNLKSPDIISLQEIQDNDGPGNNQAPPNDTSQVTSASLTLQMLVDALNAAAGPNGPHYAFIDNPFIGDDSNGGEPGGNIRNAYLYNTDRVDFVDGSLRTIGADGSAISNPAGNTDQQINPDNPFFASRPPLVATFEFNGQEVTIVNNHFSSKGGSGALYGSDPTPLDNGEVQRAAQAQAVNNFVDSLLAGDPNAKIVVSGDLNDFEFEEPLTVIRGEATVTNYDGNPAIPTATYTPGGTAVLTDLLGTLPAGERYDYVFEGNAQTLDHVLVSNGLLSGAEFDVVRINAEFADQTSDHDPLVASFTIEPPAPQTYKLQILHASDFEAGLQAIDRAKYFGAVVDYLEDTHVNSITLSSGDNYLPGPFFNAGGDPSMEEVLETALEDFYNLAPGTLNLAASVGRADISILNVLGVQASAIGNHEYDAGTREIQNIIGRTNSIVNATTPGWIGAMFPYLSANTNFAGDANLAGLVSGIQNAEIYNVNPTTVFAGAAGGLNTAQDKIAPATIITENGERIGVVGATTQIVQNISSTGGIEIIGDNVNDMPQLAAILQPTIDALLAQGINKIILVSHLQEIRFEKELAQLLHGVDVIVAGGSNTRQADAEDVARGLQPGQAPDETYPFLTTNADGKPLAIVNTDGEYSYVGRLVVEFDQNGDLIANSIDPNVSGAFAANQDTVDDLYANQIDIDGDGDLDSAFEQGSRGDLIGDITAGLDNVITTQDANTFGRTSVYLEGRRQEVRAEETNLGNLSADANLWYAQSKYDNTVQISIKNGGGIRDSIGTVEAVGGVSQESPPGANPEAGKEEGEISQLDIANSLRFNNALSLVTLTPQQLLEALENGVSNLGAIFAQVGGLRFSFDVSRPAGDRVQSVTLVDENDHVIAVVVQNGEVVADAPAAIRMVTLTFLIGGPQAGGTFARPDGFRFAEYIAANPAFANRVDLSPDTLSTDDVADRTGVAKFTDDGFEQDAFAEFLAERFSEIPYDDADTTPAFDQRIQNLVANGGNDTVLPIMGTDGEDDLVGTAAKDSIFAKNGDDRVEALGGDDFVQGGGGDDVIEGGDGNDRVEGGDGNDFVFGDAGNDLVVGGNGDDRLRGNDGNDMLVGGLGNDNANGGAGSDTFVYKQGDGSDIITEAANTPADTDTLAFADINSANVTFRRLGNDTQIELADGSVITLKDQRTGGGIEKVVFANGQELDRNGITGAIVNRGPVAIDDTAATIAEDTAAFVIPFASILGNDTDADLDTLSMTALANVIGGTAEIVEGGIRFTPAANFNGPASFDYTVSDGFGGSDVGKVSFAVTAVNDAPIAVDDTLPAIDEDAAPFVISFASILGNDTDADLDTLSITALANVVGGTAEIVEGGIRFTPALNFNGPASFDYTVSDGNGGSDVGKVSFAINAVNDAPVAVDDTLAAVDEDAAPFVISFASILGNDTDADLDTLSITALANVVGGTAEIVEGGIRFTPAPNFNGPASFDYTVSDGNGGSDIGKVSFAVNAVNDAPIAVADTGMAGENETKVFNLTANDTDVEDGVPPTLTAFEVTGVNGINLTNAQAQSAFSINQNGQLQFTGGTALFDSLNDGETATVSVNYTATDSAGLGSTGTFTLTVTGETDANVINGTNGTNLLFGTEGVDLINARGAADFVFAQGGNDIVNAGEGNDFVFGGTGNDTLNGNGGRDTLFGDDGNDVLDGGAGNDLLTGGAGNDTFVFEFSSNGNGRDLVTDFRAGAGSDDVVQLDQSVFADFNALLASSAFKDTVIGAQIEYDDGSSITLLGVNKASLTVDDFRFA